ncbi:alpha/beta hydrolase [Mucilaginibacter sp. X5P1]|uniref:alpha/beta hydrolase n=1 Tax=Mucilaginibacter sp. X5P1 TaxID=2723088 RepID=UPI0016154DBF|nr:alpha/beta hydrolase [Mucilaginibacter sp. X5P1]MBB6140399.1 acetyl esterase/lipase [Mucilaginibacter sp. X5P1]
MKNCILLLACFIMTIAKAQIPTPIHLWPQNRLIDTANGHKLIEHDVTKATDNKPGGKGVIRLADISDPTITVYTPKNANGTAVIVCPGGGYAILAIDLEGTEICTWLNSIGVTAILLKYRVPAPGSKLRYELPLQDAQRALGLVRYNAAKWNIKPDHIGILGFSAGGHLTAALSNNNTQRTYPQVDAADAVNCRPDFAILIYPAYLKSSTDPAKLAPEVQVTSITPPTFIIQTEDDPIDVQNALTYYSELKSFKVPAEMHLYPKGGHGYGMRTTESGLASYPELLQTWLLNTKF